MSELLKELNARLESLRALVAEKQSALEGYTAELVNLEKAVSAIAAVTNTKQLAPLLFAPPAEWTKPVATTIARETQPKPQPQQKPPNLARPISLSFAVSQWLQYMKREMSLRDIAEGLRACGYDWRSYDTHRTIVDLVRRYRDVFYRAKNGKVGLLQPGVAVMDGRSPRAKYSSILGSGKAAYVAIADLVNELGKEVSSQEVANAWMARYPNDDSPARQTSITAALCTAISRGLIRRAAVRMQSTKHGMRPILFVAPNDTATTPRPPDHQATVKQPSSNRVSLQQSTRDAIVAALEAAKRPMTTRNIAKLLTECGHNFRGKDPAMAVASAISNFPKVHSFGAVMMPNRTGRLMAHYVYGMPDWPHARWEEFELGDDGYPVPRAWAQKTKANSDTMSSNNAAPTDRNHSTAPGGAS